MKHIKVLTNQGPLRFSSEGKRDAFGYCADDVCFDPGWDFASCDNTSTDWCTRDYAACTVNATGYCGSDPYPPFEGGDWGPGACHYGSYDRCIDDYYGCSFGHTDECDVDN